MKKLLCSLAVAACLPGAASASQYSVTDIETFSALSSSASFFFSWVDAISTKTTTNATSIVDGKYTVLLTDALTGKVLESYKNINLNDTSASSADAYQWTFSNLVADHSYSVSLTGNWSGVKDSGKWQLTTSPTVSITPVPEPETYAMFLAGLGVIGSIAMRRKSA